MNFLVHDFVRPVLLNERLNSLGICKLMNIQDDHFILGFFNDTTSEIIEEIT